MKVDVQILAASNRDLQESTEGREIPRGSYYRLKVVDLDCRPCVTAKKIFQI